MANTLTPYDWITGLGDDNTSCNLVLFFNLEDLPNTILELNEDEASPSTLTVEVEGSQLGSAIYDQIATWQGSFTLNPSQLVGQQVICGFAAYVNVSVSETLFLCTKSIDPPVNVDQFLESTVCTLSISAVNKGT